ncbi:hypothetical protein PUR28_20185 [Streptomyces sp. BE308]|uniref:hypothetical protein n=1 Tax=Streptomyces sp. BE308 TaxID=3002529 RepID=UPI002E78018F|nr:hypothetical protein [Streptomyces sp. BE308]MEE1793044.1 hypothetical protein [Streptomyces sp. BE308]
MIRALTGYSTRHPWKVIALWAVLGVVLSALAPTLIARVTQHRTGDFLPRSYDSAAALQIAEEHFGVAARQTAFELAGLKPGQTALVNGAGGVVGSLVVRRAVDARTHMTAVDAPPHADRLRGYGADRVTGPLDAGPAAVGGPFQVVVNHVRVSPEELAQLTNYVADGGITADATCPIREDPAGGVRSASLWVLGDGAQLAAGWMPASSRSTSPPTAGWPSRPPCMGMPAPGGCTAGRSCSLPDRTRPGPAVRSPAGGRPGSAMAARTRDLSAPPGPWGRPWT